jgi:APA family basic amino acid/polyamine antiporter
MLSFSIAHLSLIRLRITKPDFERPYRGPGNVQFRGHDVPVFAVVGLFGTGLAFVVTVGLYLDVSIVGVAWLAFGLVVYALYRRNQGLDLTSTVKVVIPSPVTDHEAEYQSILVAYEQSARYYPGAIATAARLAARRRRGIHVLVAIIVPNSSPIDASLPEQEIAAQAIIEQAKLAGGRRVSGHWEKVRAGQAGRLIVNEAREMRAAAIVLPLPARRGGAIFGSTIETVLAERPCRVIIESEAESARAEPVSA